MNVQALQLMLRRLFGSARLTNSAIKARRILLIDENGINKGEAELQSVLQELDTKSFNLVQVSQTEKLPVCRIEKLKNPLEQKRELKRREQVVRIANKEKEVQLGTSISEHDLEIKLKRMDGFLQKGYRVKVVIECKGLSENPRSVDDMQNMILSRHECNLIGSVQRIGKKIMFTINLKNKDR